MHLKLWHIICLMFFVQQAQSQDQVFMEAGDTLYKSVDLLPQEILTSPNTQTGFWDFSSLLAPYVHEVYVRPVSASLASSLQADLVMMDADGTERFAAVGEAGMSLAAFRAPLDGKHLYMGVCRPAMPWRSSAPALGDLETYRGVCTFSIPPSRLEDLGLGDEWSTDSVRLSVSYSVTTEMDAFGAMFIPMGQHVVIREKKLVETVIMLEREQEGRWTTLDYNGELELPMELQNGTIYTFWSSNLPDPVAVAHSDQNGQLRSVVYRTHPFEGPLVSNFPKVPDVFVYPNPSFGEVRFDFLNLPAGNYTLEIYNILGVKQRSVGPTFIDGNRTIAMDLSDLKKGTYVYRLVDDNNNAIRSKRLVIITP